MAYRVDGKIACQFSWGAVNYDVKKVIVLDAMHPTSGASDERYAANKIYYIPAGVTPASFNDLQQYRIWHRYWESQKTLLAQNQDVCIEFVPSHDIQLTASTPIAIFTDSTTSDEDANFAIFHESGLVVAKTTGDTIDPNVSELYGLSGEKRSLSVTGVTLKAGFKYYIQYTNKTSQKNSTFQPAYFQGETGNYKVFVHDSVQNKNVANINSAVSYIGSLNDVNALAEASEGSLFLWTAASADNLQNNYIYIRSSTATSNYEGVLGTTNQELSIDDKDTILDMDSGHYFIWIGNGYSEGSVIKMHSRYVMQRASALDPSLYAGKKDSLGALLEEVDLYEYAIYTGPNIYGTDINILNGRVYRKKKAVSVDDSITLSGSSPSYDCACLVDASYATPDNKHIAINGSLYYEDRTGYVYQLKSQYIADVNKSGDTVQGYDATTITSAIADHLYYVSSGGQCPLISNWLNAGLYLWNGSSFTELNQSNYKSYFNIDDVASAIEEIAIGDGLTEVGNYSVLYSTSFNADYQSDGLRTTSLSTDKKFYLSINGQEV